MLPTLINRLIIMIHLPCYTFDLTTLQSNLYLRIDIFRAGKIASIIADFELSSFAITCFAIMELEY
jgi:hypothetical protein